jgi:hypothetical protein
MILRQGSEGELVKILQTLLNLRDIDGIFGKITASSVAGFQKRNGLVQDGVVGPLTWNKLGYKPEEMDVDTDRECYQSWIETYHLPEGEYIKKETSKKYIMIHHTAGRHNPYKCIDHWGRDSRGRVGTNYVIGGISSDGSDKQYDGKILRAIDDKYFGWHIGAGGSYSMKEQTLSIEICSAGGLKEKNGEWYTWFGEKISEDQVCILDKKFRGYKAFHKYSEEQLISLEALLRYLAEKHGISLKLGMQMMLETGDNPYEWNSSVYNGKIRGLLSHTNVRKDKSDVFPQPELTELIKRL